MRSREATVIDRQRRSQSALAVAAPPAIAAAIAGVAAGARQAGIRLYPEMLKPRFDKLNPLPKLKELGALRTRRSS